MNTPTQAPRDYRFVIGLLAGTVVGAGLAVWLAPRAASELGGIRDHVADAVVRGAHQVEGVAKAAKRA